MAEMSRRLPLLTSSALIAIACSSSAHGQAAFQGTPTTAAGTVRYGTSGTNTDVVTLGSHSAIIDWTPTDNSGTGTIDFLPAGKTAIFQSATDADFTVLNRINPTDTSRPVEFDGHVISQFVNASGAASRAGNVWFYTPGGIIVGATGVFDVGSLILTTNAIDTTNGVPSPGSGITFKGASGSISNIIVKPGGQINAVNPGSFVALVAPRIAQGGTVNVNGSVGYVAAEAADITINAGLFSITNTIGSQVAPGGETTLTHTGTTTGAATTDSTNPHNIYMVAIPKNDAVTMLVSGNVGYQAAASASVVNGNIVLDAGYTNNDGGFTSGAESYVNAAGGRQASTISVGAGTYSSSLFAYSNGSFTLSSAAGNIAAGDITASADHLESLFATGNHSITGGKIALIGFRSRGTGGGAAATVDTGSTLTATGLTIDASQTEFRPRTTTATLTVDGTATLGSLALLSDLGAGGLEPVVRPGASTLTVDGGTLTVTGASAPASGIATMISSTGSDATTDPVPGASVHGGTASVDVRNGGHASLGATSMVTTATNYLNEGGSATGGTVSITASSGGAVDFAGNALTLDARATIGAPGARAQGGTVNVIADGGTIKLADPATAVSLYTRADGSTATGGLASLRALNGGTLMIAGSAGIDASATNQPGATAPARGGTAAILADTDGAIAIAGPVTISALADAGAVYQLREPANHDAVGGAVSVTSANGAKVTFGTALTLSADATGVQDASVTDGSATAGSITIQTTDGTITMPSFYAEAIARANASATDAATVAHGGSALVEARGGAITLTDASARSSIELGARDGAATGGTANVRARLGGAISVPGALAVHTDAAGGTGPDAIGYTGIGGSASVTANGGTLTLAGLDVSADGYGGDGTAGGGNGIGGYAVVQAGTGGLIHNSGATYLNTTGQGGDGGSGAANGTGGISAVYAGGGTITLDDVLGVFSTGTGGGATTFGRDAATQGIGRGGASSLAADGGGTITLTGATIDASGQGGAGGGDRAGTGIGGTATFETGRDGQAGNVSAQTLYVRSEGTGGSADANAGGEGGIGEGGIAQFSVGAGTVGATTLLVGSAGTGTGGKPQFNRVSGPSGAGAVAGTAIVAVTGGTLAVQSGEISASAVAGSGSSGEYGGSGGDAGGGSAQMRITGGALSGGDWTLFETAQGGTGVSGSGGSGGNGGRADAGSIALSLSGGTASINSLSASLTAIGGQGGAGGTISFQSQGGAGGGNGGVATTGALGLLGLGGRFSTVGNLSLVNVATGGAGGAGGGGGSSPTTAFGPGGVGGAGGSASVGATSLTATGGTIVSSRPSLAANAVAGLGGTGGFGQGGTAASGATGGVIGGTATIETDGQGLLAFGDTSLDASTAGGASGTGGSVNLIALDTGGGAATAPITMATLTVTNNGPGNGPGGPTVIQGTAPIAVTGDASVSGTGAITVTGLSSTGMLTADSTADAVSLSGVTASSVAASGKSVSISSPGTLIVASARSTGGDIAISATGSLVLATAVTSAGGISLSSANGNVTAGDLTSFGGLSATSTGGTLALGNATAGNPTSGGGIMLTGSGGVTAGTLLATDSIAAISSGGAVALGQVTSSGGSARVTATGAITTGDVTAAGSIYLTGGAAITAGNLKAGVGTLRAGEGGGSAGGTDPAPDGIASGFDQFSIDRCDDCATSAIMLPFDINFFGSEYANTYVSNNGYFTFNSASGGYTPTGLGSGYSGQAIIAAFFADVDTRNPASGLVTYGNGTFAGRQAFGATWNAVGYYSSAADKTNTFQIILTNRADTGVGNFDIYYNYGAIGWETGAANSGVGGLGGTSAAVGFNAGTGNQAGTFFQLPGSLVPGSFINGGTAPLASVTNDGNAGQLLFSVRNGLVVVGGASEPPTVHVSNIATGNTADIRLGDISGEAAEVHGAGKVTVGNVTVADRHSGIAAPGNPFATVLDASNGLITGDISGAGFVAIGAAQGDISTGTITSSSSVAVLGDGAIALGAVTTGLTASDTLFIAGNAAKTGLTGFDFTTLLSGKTFDPASLATATAYAGSAPTSLAGVTNNIVTINGPVSAGNVDAASLNGFAGGAISATNDITIRSGAVTLGGAVTAGANLSASTGGLLTLQGGVDGATISLASADIAATGAIGSARTTSLSFTDTAGGTMSVGDGAGDAGYSLSAGELANAHAGTITITSAADYGDPSIPSQIPRPGNMTIGDLTLSGANGLASGTLANLTGENGGLVFQAYGDIQLVGHLDVGHLGSGNQVTLSASGVTSGAAITGALPAAGIALTDANGGLAGTLNLAADRIEFDTAATAQAVTAAATLKDRSDALAISAGGGLTDSYIRAGGVNFTVGSALYMQNSGIISSRRDDRAGVTAGAGGISLASLRTDPVQIVLNARLAGATGEVTGADVVGQIHLGGETPFAFAPLSTVNGCLTDGTVCTPPVETIEHQVQPVQDVVQQVALPSGIGQSSGYSFQNPQLVSMTGLAPAALAPLIDEPVTGAGNDNLWVGVGVSADQPLSPMGGAKSGKKPPPK